MQKKLVNSMVLLLCCVSLKNMQGMSKTLDAEFYKASGSGDIAVLEERLKAGVNIDAARPDNGMTALHNAVEQGQVGAVQKLIEAHADVSKENDKNQTPISLARDMYKKAVDIGDMQRQVDYTAILGAFIGNGSIADQDFLRGIILENSLQIERSLQGGANPNIRGRGKNGIIPLHYVILNYPIAQVLKVIKLLVDKGADVSAKDEAGHTPLTQAIRRDDPEAIELLLELKADPNQEAYRGYTPLLYALSIGSEKYQQETNEILDVLLKGGALASKPDADGRTPLLVAAEKGNVPAANMLLEKGADVNVKSDDNDMPLTSALEKGSLPMVKLLLAKGADVLAKNRQGETVAQIAVRKKLTTPEWEAVIGKAGDAQQKGAQAEPQKSAEPERQEPKLAEPKSEEPKSPPLPPKRVLTPVKDIPQPPSELQETLEDLTQALSFLEKELKP